MNTFFTIILLFLGGLLHSQSDSTTFSIEYTPGRTGTWTGNPNANDYGWGHMGFVKVNFPLDTIWYVSTGAGFMNSHERQHTFSGMFEFKDIYNFWTPYYLVFPVGIKYQRGSFFINPEIGLAYNFANPLKQYYETIEGYRLQRDKKDEDAIAYIRKWTIPAMMTFGYEIKARKLKILLGAKAYVGLSSYTKNHLPKRYYYGFGVLTGLRL